MSKGRYSLISTIDGVSTLIKIKEYDEKTGNAIEKTKVSLPTIDFLTSNFSSSEECNEYFGLPKQSKLSIVYQSNKVQKEIPCIFADNQLMRYFASAIKFDENAIIASDPYFRKFLNNVFIAVCQSFIRKHIMKDYTINTYIKDKINEYLQFDSDEIFILRQLEQELQQYKCLRSVVLSIKLYEKKSGLKVFDFATPPIDGILPEKEVEISKFIPDDDNEEPVFPPNSEEEAAYLKYLDSLPVESFPKVVEEQFGAYQLSKKRKHNKNHI